MAGKILSFPVPKSTDLLEFLEEHVATPSAGARLLQCPIPSETHDVAGIASGVFIWDHFDHKSGGRDGYLVELNYKILSIAAPEWIKETPAGRWFLMRFERPEGGRLADITLRQNSIRFGPQLFCPRCHAQTRPYIDELTGEGCCDECAPELWPGLAEAMQRGNWSHIRSSRTILVAREKKVARTRISTDRFSILRISWQFFERHPDLLTTLPRAFKVYNHRIKNAALGYFVADPSHMPIAEWANVEVHEGGPSQWLPRF